MSGGGGSKSTTTKQTTEPWKGLQPYLSSAYPALGDLYGTNVTDAKGKVVGWNQDPNAGPQYYPGSTVAGINPLEQIGQEQQLGGAGFAQGLANLGLGGIENMLAYATSNTARGGEAGALQGMNQLLAAGDPSSNPYFQNALASAIRPVTEQFTEQVLPGIRRGAIAAGGAGGSRQGIAEGLAGRGFANAIGDIAANMGNQAYGQGLQAMQAGAGIGSNLLGMGLESAGRGAALAPSVQQMGFVPGQITEQIGQQRTADAQQRIDADVARWNYEQQLPFTMMSDYLGMLQGSPYGSTTGTQTAPGRSTVGSMGAGGLMGYGLTGSPWGALAGGMLGLF